MSQHDVRQLRAFAVDILAAHLGDLDGSEIEDIAVRHGLLERVIATKACAEDCPCCEFGFPSTCYRKTAIVTGNASEGEA